MEAPRAYGLRVRWMGEYLSRILGKQSPEEVAAWEAADIYLIRLQDPQAVEYVHKLAESYKERCVQLSRLAELGCRAAMLTSFTSAIEAVDRSFNSLVEKFKDRAEYLEKVLDDFVQTKARNEFDRYFGNDGVLRQALSNFVSDSGPLASMLKDRGKQLSDYFDPNNKESFVSKVEDILKGYLGEDGSLSKLFDPKYKGSYAGKLEDLLKEYFGEEAGRVKQLLDPAREDSPFGKIKRELEKQQKAVQEELKNSVTEIRHSLDKQLAEIRANLDNAMEALKKESGALAQFRSVLEGLEKERREKEEKQLMLNRSPQGGMSFQEAVYQYLRDYAGLHGDSAEEFFDKSGLMGKSKKGDIVYSLNVGGQLGRPVGVRIVLEAKDSSCQADRVVDAELKEAMQNRDCSYGILVATVDKNIDGAKGRLFTRCLRRISPDKFVVLVDRELEYPVALNAAINIVEQHELAKVSEKEVEIDEAEINSILDGINAQLMRFRVVKGSLTSITNTASSIRETIDEMEAELKARLSELRAAIRIKDAAGAAAGAVEAEGEAAAAAADISAGDQAYLHS